MANTSHPHLNPPPSTGGGRIRKLNYCGLAMTIQAGFRVIAVASPEMTIVLTPVLIFSVFSFNSVVKYIALMVTELLV